MNECKKKIFFIGKLKSDTLLQIKYQTIIVANKFRKY